MPRWSEAEIDALEVSQLRHALKVLSIPIKTLKKKAQLAARLKEAMPQAVGPQPGNDDGGGAKQPKAKRQRR